MLHLVPQQNQCVTFYPVECIINLYNTRGSDKDIPKMLQKRGKIFSGLKANSSGSATRSSLELQEVAVAHGRQSHDSDNNMTGETNKYLSY